MGMTVITAVCNVAICVRVCTTLLGLPGGMTEADGHHHDDHHHDHPHEHGLLAHMIWLPGLVIVSFQFLGGFIGQAVQHQLLQGALGLPRGGQTAA